MKIFFINKFRSNIDENMEHHREPAAWTVFNTPTATNLQSSAIISTWKMVYVCVYIYIYIYSPGLSNERV